MLLWNDARTYQILFLALFLMIGLGTRDWTLQPGMIVVAIATCVITQWVMVANSSQQSAVSWSAIRRSNLSSFILYPFSRPSLLSP
jgi:hypothetical protein